MRLLNTTTLEPREFIGDDFPPYAILSHVWSPEELSYESFITPGDKTGYGYEKITKLCELARTIGDRQDISSLEWAWIDTVCIDKRSSAELSEAINSMYHWYGKSAVCYVFLPDVEPVSGEDVENDHRQFGNGVPFSEKQFHASKYHTRGWTLQELIAPNNVVFFNSSFGEIGRKISIDVDRYWALYSANHATQGSSAIRELQDIAKFILVLAEATGINEKVMDGRDKVKDICIAQRMSWASRRRTTRGEDMSYCLLGLLDVNMALLYGEGAERAFRRLQLELVSHSTDESVFAWNDTSRLGRYWSGLLAPNPAAFAHCETFVRRHILNQTTWAVTFRGIEVTLPLWATDGMGHFPIVVVLWPLSCTAAGSVGCFLKVWLDEDVVETTNTSIQAWRSNILPPETMDTEGMSTNSYLDRCHRLQKQAAGLTAPALLHLTNREQIRYDVLCSRNKYGLVRNGFRHVAAWCERLANKVYDVKPRTLKLYFPIDGTKPVWYDHDY